jgi:hypothetical protein
LEQSPAWRGAATTTSLLLGRKTILCLCVVPLPLLAHAFVFRLAYFSAKRTRCRPTRHAPDTTLLTIRRITPWCFAHAISFARGFSLSRVHPGVVAQHPAHHRSVRRTHVVVDERRVRSFLQPPTSRPTPLVNWPRRQALAMGCNDRHWGRQRHVNNQHCAVGQGRGSNS